MHAYMGRYTYIHTSAYENNKLLRTPKKIPNITQKHSQKPLESNKNARRLPKATKTKILAIMHAKRGPNLTSNRR